MPPPLALAIDLGGTQLRAALVDEAGQVRRRHAVLTEVTGGPPAIIAQMLHLANSLFGDDRSRVIAVGVSAPGPTNRAGSSSTPSSRARWTPSRRRI